MESASPAPLATIACRVQATRAQLEACQQDKAEQVARVQRMLEQQQEEDEQVIDHLREMVRPLPQACRVPTPPPRTPWGPAHTP